MKSLDSGVYLGDIIGIILVLVYNMKFIQRTAATVDVWYGAWCMSSSWSANVILSDLVFSEIIKASVSGFNGLCPSGNWSYGWPGSRSWS